MPSRRSVAPPLVAPKPPPVATESEARPQTYTVKRGDTLYLIALDHGLDYRELAAWNSIENVNLILVGQVLRLSPPGETQASAAVSGPSGVTTAPLRTVPPIVSGGPGSAPTPGTSAAPAAAPAAPSSHATTPEKTVAPAPSIAATRNSDSYKTQPKALKEPYSERALREMQQRVQGAPAIATAPGGSVASAPAIAATPPQAAPPAAEPAPLPAASAPPQVIARAEPKLESKPAPPPAGAEDEDKLDWVWPATGKLVTGFSDTANLKGIDIAGKAGQPVLASAAGKVVYAGTGLRGYGKLIIIKHSKNYLSAYAHNKEILVKEGQQVTRGQKIAEMGNSDADQVKLHFEIRRLGKPMDPLKYLPPA